jgi:hypothetical protein
MIAKEVEFVSLDGLNEWLEDYPFHMIIISIQKIVVPAKYLELGNIPERNAYIVFYYDTDMN